MTDQEAFSLPSKNTALWADWQKAIVTVLLLLALPVVLYFMRPVLGPLLLTFAIAFVLMYPIRWLQRLKLSYRVSALIVYFIFLILSMVAVGWFMVYAVQSLVETVQSARQFVQEVFADATGKTEIGLSLDFLQDGLKALTVVGAGVSLLTSPSEFFAAVMDKISRFTSFVSAYGFVVVVLLFLLPEWPRTARIVSERIPDASRREYTILLRRVVNIGQSYLLGSLLIVLFYWLVTALIFALSGVPHAIVLGLLVAIPNFIPQGGGMISAIMVFVITMMTGSTTFALNRLLFAFIEMTIFMLISGVAYYFVDVRIYSKSVNVPVWVILVGIMVFAATMGGVGAFIAAAAVAILGEVFDFVLKKLQGIPPYPEEPEPVAAAQVEAVQT